MILQAEMVQEISDLKVRGIMRAVLPMNFIASFLKKQRI